MAEKKLQQYEMMVMLKPDLTQKANKEGLQSVRDLIAEAGGTINHEDIWDKRDLAYNIGGYDEAFYAILYFTLDPKNLDELKADLDLEQPILRKLIIKFPSSLTVESYLEESKRVVAEQEAAEEERRKIAEAKAADAPKVTPRKKLDDTPRRTGKEETKTEKAGSEIDAMAK